MAILTSNKEGLLSPEFTPCADPARAGTYHKNQVVYKDETGYIAPFASGSTVQGITVVGAVLDYTKVDNTGDLLPYAKNFTTVLSASGFTGVENDAVIWMEDSTTAYSAQGDDRLPAGYVDCFVTSSVLGFEGVRVREFGTVPSSSV